MIEQLMVKDYILFDYALVDFNTGMNVITGETGAGKSLLIDAIGYLSGDRIVGNIVRKGKDKAILQMVCSCNNSQIKNILDENGFEVDDQIIIQRTVNQKQKSTIRINQQVTTLSFVRQIISYMVDVHSQMDTYQLMNLDVQLDLLDSFAQSESLRKDVKNSYAEYSSLKHEYNELITKSMSDDELDYLTNQYNLINETDVKENELEELSSQIKELNELEKNTEIYSQSIYALTKDSNLMDTCYDLSRLLNKNEATQGFAQEFQEMYYRMDEIKEELQSQLDQYKNNSVSLDDLQARLYTIKSLYKRFGGSYESLIENKKRIEKQIDLILHRENVLKELQNQLITKEESYLKLAKELSKKRKKVFKHIENEVVKECQDLMLEHAQFKISCKEKDPSKDGIDAIEFLVSMNPGQPFVPLKDSASGGELSRLMLALKVVFHSQNGIDTIVFDEIDTGVSGKVAFAMGNKMHALSKHYQVLCITHLSSVACWASTHFCVQKESDSSSTKTSVKTLNEDEIIEELAMMSSGQVNSASLEAAKELKERVNG